MSRRKGRPIPVEDRATVPPCIRLGNAMLVLQSRDHARYLTVVELAEAYAAAFESLDTDAEFNARLARLSPTAREAN